MPSQQQQPNYQSFGGASEGGIGIGPQAMAGNQNHIASQSRAQSSQAEYHPGNHSQQDQSGQSGKSSSSSSGQQTAQNESGDENSKSSKE
jgi:hypothetical protein